MVSHITVEDALRARITAGVWPPGRKLPPERDLAQEFSASRNTIRKAIRSLAADAYISTTENARPVVIYQGKRGNGPDERAGYRTPSDGAGSKENLNAESILDASPLEVLEARLVIEPEAAVLATLRARSENINEIQTALSESLSAKDLENFEYWDGQLHQAIFRATRNSALIGYYHAVNQIRNQPSWLALKKKSVTAERQRLYDRQHTAIVDAIVNRVPDKAKSAMRAHLESVRKAMMLST